MKRLSEIKVGSTVVIKSFEKNDIFLKLMEMGCVPGETIRVEQVAPLGDPIAIEVSGYHLSLRLDEAQNIFVEEMNLSSWRSDSILALSIRFMLAIVLLQAMFGNTTT